MVTGIRDSREDFYDRFIDSLLPATGKRSQIARRMSCKRSEEKFDSDANANDCVGVNRSTNPISSVVLFGDPSTFIARAERSMVS